MNVLAGPLFGGLCRMRQVAATLVVATTLVAVLAACSGDVPTPPPDNPTPGISVLSPTEVEQGSSDQTLVVTGSDFVATSVVRVNGADRPTTFVSGTEVRAALPSADFASAGSLQIVVSNPAPGGGASNIASLTVRQKPNPVPVIASLTPTFVAAGATGVTITITGTGFVAQSAVIVGFNGHGGVTYVSPTELRMALTDAEIDTSGTLKLRVVNPPPGGGTSNEVSLNVRAPVPALTSLAESQTTAGQTGYTLRVTGTSFQKNSVVRFNGASRPTTFVSATTLTAALSEADLREAGTFDITVTTPISGGGASNPLPFQIVNGVPAITLLPSMGAHAGRPGFSLILHGIGFVPSSSVQWNGATRPSQYLAATRIMVDIPASDIASAGTAQLTVVNPGPGGGTSAPASLTVRSVPSPTVTSRVVRKLEARDLAPDDQRGLIYLSIRSSAAVDANSVVALDPATGNIVQRVVVGSNPGRLARSDDGQFLYVGLDGVTAVRRVDLSSFAAGLQWSLASGIAGEIRVLPGQPRSVAVARQAPGTIPPQLGVTIYDDGTPRPQSSDGHTGANRLEVLSSPDTIYGYNNSTSGFQFYTLAVSASGVRDVYQTAHLLSGFYTQITGAAGRIYGTDGSIVDAQRRARVGSMGASGESLLVDAALGRAFFLTDSDIAVYDLNNFQLLGRVPVTGTAFDHPARSYAHLVRWGADGLAFLDMDEVFVIRSPLFGP